MEAERALSATAASAVRLLMLTGCRKSEIVSLRWSGWIWSGATSASRTARRVPGWWPLAASAMELLGQVPADFGICVLPAAKGGGHYTGLQKDWGRVAHRAGLPGLRLHDLRHFLSRPSQWRTGTLSS